MDRLWRETESPDVSSQCLPLVDHFCSLLIEHRELNSVRVSLDSRSWHGQAREIVGVAKRYGLRCWFTKSDVVLQVPCNRVDLRIDKRAGIPVVTFSQRVEKGD